MIDLTATLLEVVDRTSRRTGRVSHVIDRIGDWMLPQTTASAGTCPSGFVCGSSSCGEPCFWIARRKKYIYYDQSPTCTSIMKCSVGCKCHIFGG